jgi:UDP-N-acetylmuramate-alanine ligase
MNFEETEVYYFLGIGGIGMSAIALILHKIGCQIQGSDLSQNNNNSKILSDKDIQFKQSQLTKTYVLRK